jgi:hypothetical protein
MDYYEIMGLRRDASHEEIERAYDGLRTRYHLDKCIASDIQSRQWVDKGAQAVHDAYAVLSDAYRRGLVNTHVETVAGEGPSLPAILEQRLEPLDAFARVHFAPRIPPKKLYAALRSYGHGLKSCDVLVLIDDTVLGGAGDGAMLTQYEVRMKALWGAPHRRAWREVQTIQALGRAVFINAQRVMEFKKVQSRELRLLFEAVQAFVLSVATLSRPHRSKLRDASLLEAQGGSAVLAGRLAVYQQARHLLIDLYEKIEGQKEGDEGYIDRENAAAHFAFLMQCLQRGTRIEATVRELLRISALSQKVLEVVASAGAEVPACLVSEAEGDSHLVIELRFLLQHAIRARERVLRKEQVDQFFVR